MTKTLFLHNTITRKKEEFKPIKPPHVGMYVCGPTVYGDPHLGHARAYVTFDIVFRTLKELGYKVRYVRNITDVGHLENDGDTGEDKIGKKARLEQIEPMEVVHMYTNSFHDYMRALNCKSPSIEPTASGHIPEQIEMIQDILKAGFAYEVNGSVYFDVKKYHESHHYGKLSGRIVEDLLSQTRDLDGQDEKRESLDFALWKKASAEHIMRWSSPWSDGFPGWHLECSVMSTKYLGETFDIHGGGMDLLFPHHECEIAQSRASSGSDPCNYWIHNNMITINGQKMGKSLGNFITLGQMFSGEHAVLEQAYHPMAVRFFILQSHYRSPLDFSNDALKAAEKGLKRLLNASKLVSSLKGGKNQGEMDEKVNAHLENFEKHLLDDFSTPQAIAELFELSTIIQSISNGQISKDSISQGTIENLQNQFIHNVHVILGLQDMSENNQSMEGLMELVIELRKSARERKDYATSDKIRDSLNDAGIQLKDGKDGTSWSFS